MQQIECYFIPTAAFVNRKIGIMSQNPSGPIVVKLTRKKTVAMRLARIVLFD